MKYMKIFKIAKHGPVLSEYHHSFLIFTSIDDLVKDEDRLDQQIFLIQELPANFEQQLQNAKQRVAQQERQKQLAIATV